MHAIAGADVIFINGLGFETWAQTLITESGTDAVISTATAGIEPIVIDGSIDPHAWNSIVNAKVYVGNIGTELSRLLPDHSIAINYNAQKYIESLEELDSSAREDCGVTNQSANGCHRARRVWLLGRLLRVNVSGAARH